MIIISLTILPHWTCLNVQGRQLYSPGEEERLKGKEKFVVDIIKTWRLKFPTIIMIEEELPNFCMTKEWWLCLNNKVDELPEPGKSSQHDGL